MTVKSLMCVGFLRSVALNLNLKIIFLLYFYFDIKTYQQTNISIVQNRKKKLCRKIRQIYKM